MCNHKGYYFIKTSFCKCPVDLDIAFVELQIYIVRAVSLPIFLLTLIINQITAKKRTTHLIFFQCHIVAYFFFFLASTIKAILESKCSYWVLAMEIMNDYFFNCVFNFLVMTSIDIYLTFYIMDTNCAQLALKLQKFLLSIGQFVGWILPILIILLMAMKLWTRLLGFIPPCTSISNKPHT